jgi:futalosine hydrolase
VLVLVPTDLERSLLLPDAAGGATPAGRASPWPGRPGVAVATCGFGLSAAGAGAGVLLARRSPSVAVLAGLAGALADDVVPGQVLVGTAVALDGVGVGEGERFVPFAEIDGPMAGRLSSLALPLSAPAALSGRRGLLLSAASAAAAADEVERRRRRHPDALAEDLETHAVALAAQAASVRLVVVRAVSNRAGDRDHAGWKAREALAAVREALERWWSAEAP